MYVALTLALVFALHASAAYAADFTLSWNAPTTNEDGSQLTDLSGFKVHYGTTSGAYTTTTDVGNVTTYKVANLTDGQTYFFAVTAYDTSGNQSAYSNEASARKMSDLVIDFGSSYGMYVLYNGTSWSKFHNLSPDVVAEGNLDGNGTDDMVLDFGSYGTYVYYNNSTWSKIHGMSPTLMATGDLAGDGSVDLVAVFDGYGTYAYDYAAGWTKLHDLSPSLITTGDMDGDGKDELIAAFDGYGIFVYQNNLSWSRLHNLVPELMVADDIDFSGKEDLIVDFGPTYGTYVYYNDSTWTKLYDLSPTLMLADNIGGAVMGFTGYGLYVYDDLDGSWDKIHNLVPETGAIVDVNGDGSEDGVFDFGSYGVFVYDNASGWSKLHSLNPDNDAGICAPEIDGN